MAYPSFLLNETSYKWMPFKGKPYSWSLFKSTCVDSLSVRFNFVSSEWANTPDTRINILGSMISESVSGSLDDSQQVSQIQNLAYKVQITQKNLEQVTILKRTITGQIKSPTIQVFIGDLTSQDRTIYVDVDCDAHQVEIDGRPGLVYCEKKSFELTKAGEIVTKQQIEAAEQKAQVVSGLTGTMSSTDSPVGMSLMTSILAADPTGTFFRFTKIL